MHPMTLLFRIRPSTPNIGNDAIAYATAELLRSAFGPGTNIVDVPALADGQLRGGLTARQVYDLNRLADGVVIGGGNLFENGELTVDATALGALRVPLLLIGLSHGRIHDDSGALIDRTDSMPPETVRQLTAKAVATLVRDHSSHAVLRALGVDGVDVGGCPTMFLAADSEDAGDDGRILLSLRHPNRMSVPPPLQWRIADDVRRLVSALGRDGESVFLACHDYADLEFAAAFPGLPRLYFNDVYSYLEALRRCRLSITYRLHAFLPCLAFGTPSIHLSYDERSRETVMAAGMGEWDIDLLHEPDPVGTVMTRRSDLGRYRELRRRALEVIRQLRATTDEALRRFVEAVRTRGTPAV